MNAPRLSEEQFRERCREQDIEGCPHCAFKAAPWGHARPAPVPVEDKLPWD